MAKKQARSHERDRFKPELLLGLRLAGCYYFTIPDMPRTKGSRFLTNRPYDVHADWTCSLGLLHVMRLELKVAREGLFPLEKVKAHQVVELEKGEERTKGRARSYVVIEWWIRPKTLNRKWAEILGDGAICETWAFPVAAWKELAAELTAAGEKSVGLPLVRTRGIAIPEERHRKEGGDLVRFWNPAPLMQRSESVYRRA